MDISTKIQTIRNRSKEKRNNREIQDPRYRYRFFRSADCIAFRSDFVPDGSFSESPEGSSFPTWFTEDGWTAAKSAEIFEEKGYQQVSYLDQGVGDP